MGGKGVDEAVFGGLGSTDPRAAVFAVAFSFSIFIIILLLSLHAHAFSTVIL